MTDANTIAAELACAKLAVSCYSFQDIEDYAAAAELFTDDGSWLRGPNLVTGKAEILKTLKARPKSHFTRHLVTNVIVTVAGDNSASASAYLTPFRAAKVESGVAAMPSIDLVGDLAYTFRREDGAWKIASLTPTIVMQRA